MRRFPSLRRRLPRGIPCTQERKYPHHSALTVRVTACLRTRQFLTLKPWGFLRSKRREDFRLLIKTQKTARTIMFKLGAF
jgi:hypothetical protein